MHTIFLTAAALQMLATPVSAYMSPDEIFDVPQEAQSSKTPMTPEEESEKAEIQQRIFYRNGETKTVSDQSASAVPVVSEPVVSDPVIAEETTSSSEYTAPVLEETTEEPAPAVEAARGISTSMIVSGAIAVVIVIGGLLFLLRMFLRRFKPTNFKEKSEEHTPE